ncbi:MAG: 2-phospho-L-lactate guanylyltransferase [Novosphingobium sp.]
MNCWAVIPFKQAGQAKGRLAAALSEAERAALAVAMLHHVVGVAGQAVHVRQLCLLGPTRLDFPEHIVQLTDPGTGLNPALHTALASVSAAGADRMIVLFADLPLLTSQDIELLAAAPAETIAMAPDRHGTGTNALSLPLPAAKGFTFCFGPDSFARHKAEADRQGIRIEEVHSQGLARDVDMPEDLPDAAGLTGT